MAMEQYPGDFGNSRLTIRQCVSVTLLLLALLPTAMYAYNQRCLYEQSERRNCLLLGELRVNREKQCQDNRALRYLESRLARYECRYGN